MSSPPAQALGIEVSPTYGIDITNYTSTSMPSGEERLNSVATDERDVFVTDCRHLYLEFCAKLKRKPSIESALIIIGKNPAKRYVERCKLSLDTHHVIVVVARGPELSKLVAVVEQIKSRTKGKVTQMNKIFRQSSLINPGYSAQNSISNVQMFFGDEIDSLSPSEAARKEIKGHKVYDVACMAVVLVDGEVRVSHLDYPDWTIQGKAQ